MLVPEFLSSGLAAVWEKEQQSGIHAANMLTPPHFVLFVKRAEPV
jgi:hypothetical protein